VNLTALSLVLSALAFIVEISNY